MSPNGGTFTSGGTTANHAGTFSSGGGTAGASGMSGGAGAAGGGGAGAGGSAACNDFENVGMDVKGKSAKGAFPQSGPRTTSLMARTC